MEILNINLPANGTVQMRKAGSYIEILQATGAINVTLWTPSGGTTSTIKGGLAGLFLDADFGAIDIQDASGSAQSVQLLVCDAGENGGSRRQPGNVRIIDEITDAITNFSFAPALTVAAFQVTTILAPAANVRGVILRQAGNAAQAGVGGSSNSTFMAAKSTPISFANPTQRYSINGVADNAQTLKTASQNMNKLLPAGWGLYAISDIATAAATQCNGTIAYELL